MIDYLKALHVLVQVHLIFIFTLDETKTHHEKRAWSSISGNPFLDYEALSSFFFFFWALNETAWLGFVWILFLNIIWQGFLLWIAKSLKIK